MKEDILKVPKYDAVFIRAITFPLNPSYLVACMAENHGIKVIDDSRSMLICDNKVHMYRLMMQNKVPIAKTEFLEKAGLSVVIARRLFKELGSTLVLKAPDSSFSRHVDKVESIPQFMKLAKKYFRFAEEIVVQEYTPTNFDWRVTTLGGKVLFVCKYMMPPKYWKIRKISNKGETIWCKIKTIDRKKANKRLLDMALRASKAVGNGIYGVDLKEINGKYHVVEVNDNPNIDAGGEDVSNPELYGEIIDYLMKKR
jgi:glutathione synthase/RimK-type ligase-like ATP-grasp enzyme